MMDEEINTAAEALEAAALPRCYTAKDGEDGARQETLPEAVTRKPVAEKSPAQWAYERLAVYLQKFEETLDSDHEVAMGFSGADAGVLRIEGMGYFDPDIVTFYGTDPAGGKMQQIQHVSQLNVILRSFPKRKEAKAPRRIGFRLVEKLAEDAGVPGPDKTDGEG